MEESFAEGFLWGMGFKEAVGKKEGKKRCRFCRRLIPADAKYCPYCGKRVE